MQYNKSNAISYSPNVTLKYFAANYCMMNTPHVTHRKTVTLTADVVDALDKVLDTKECENYSQAIRKAVRIAYVEK